MPRRSSFRHSFLRKSRPDTNLACMPHRRQPHIYPKAAPLFLTWRLHGSITPPPSPGPLTAGDFLWLDRQLDNYRRGPMHLSRPDIATVVIECLHKGVELGHYDLDAWVIMPNHVHILLHPKNLAQRPDELTQRRQRTLCQSRAGPNRRPILAKRILRPPGPKLKRICTHPRLHRTKSGRSRARRKSRSLFLVKRQHLENRCARKSVRYAVLRSEGSAHHTNVPTIGASARITNTLLNAFASKNRPK